MNEPLLSLRGITKSFGSVRAIQGVDLDLPRGQVTALVQREARDHGRADRGAGRRTTRMVLDLIKRLADRGVTVMVVWHNLNDELNPGRRAGSARRSRVS